MVIIILHFPLNHSAAYPKYYPGKTSDYAIDIAAHVYEFPFIKSILTAVAYLGWCNHLVHICI